MSASVSGAILGITSIQCDPGGESRRPPRAARASCPVACAPVSRSRQRISSLKASRRPARAASMAPVRVAGGQPQRGTAGAPASATAAVTLVLDFVGGQPAAYLAGSRPSRELAADQGQRPLQVTGFGRLL